MSVKARRVLLWVILAAGCLILAGEIALVVLKLVSGSFVFEFLVGIVIILFAAISLWRIRRDK